MPETYNFSRRPLDQELAAIERQVRTSVDTVLGRSTAGGRALEEIPCTAAGRALLDDASASAQRTTLGLGTAATVDYTSGNWTPSVGGNATYTTQVGRYVQIGALIYATFQITINVLGTGSTTTVSGLPVADGNLGISQGGAITFFENVATNIIATYVAVTQGGTSLAIRSLAAAAATPASNAIFGNGARVDGFVHYRA